MQNANISISTAMHKMQAQWIKDLYIKPTKVDMIEDKVGSILDHIGTGDYFLNVIPIAQTLRQVIKKQDLMKLKSFCKAKDTVNKTKEQSTEWEKIFTNQYNF